MTDKKLTNLFTETLKNLREEQILLDYPPDYFLIQASHPEPVQLKSSLQYEFSFKEKILRNLVKTLNTNPIYSEYSKVFGTEVLYPVTRYSGWEGKKIDIGLNHIKDTLFEYPIEGKIWYANEYAWDVWTDIFKLYGYKDNKVNQAGKRKFMFVQYATNYLEEGKKNKTSILEIIKDEFLSLKSWANNGNTYDLFFNALTKGYGWTETETEKVLSDIGRERINNKQFIGFEDSYLVSDGKDNHYFFLELLSDF